MKNKGSILISTAVLLGLVVVLSLLLISLNFMIFNRLNKDIKEEKALLSVQVEAQEIIIQIDYELFEDQLINNHLIIFNGTDQTFSFTHENSLYQIEVVVNINKQIDIWKVEVK